MRKRISGFIVSVLIAALAFSVFCSNLTSRKVNAAAGMWCSSSAWDIGNDEYQFNFGFWGCQDGDVINFRIVFNNNEVFVTDRGAAYNVSDGSDVITGSFTYTAAISSCTMSVSVMTMSGPGIVDYSIVSVTPAPTEAPTTTTTAAPTTAATTTAAPTPAPAATTTRSTTAAPTATTTTKPAGDGDSTPVTTAATQPAGGDQTAPAAPDAAQPSETEATTATTSSETSESTEETEESTDETIIETSEELDIPTSPTGVMAAVEEETEETNPPTPTPLPRIYDAGIKKNHFPWWILLVAAVVIASALRYRKLAAQDLYMDEIIYEFIPGRVIGNIVDKVRGTKTADITPVVEEDKPKVINGYLQTSNTRTIRPEFSNVAAINKAKELEKSKNASVAKSASANASEDNSVDLSNNIEQQSDMTDDIISSEE